VYWLCGYNCRCAYNRAHPIVKGSRWAKRESEFGEDI
jgi:hypothetical protein